MLFRVECYELRLWSLPIILSVTTKKHIQRTKLFSFLLFLNNFQTNPHFWGFHLKAALWLCRSFVSLSHSLGILSVNWKPFFSSQWPRNRRCKVFTGLKRSWKHYKNVRCEVAFASGTFPYSNLSTERTSIYEPTNTLKHNFNESWIWFRGPWYSEESKQFQLFNSKICHCSPYFYLAVVICYFRQLYQVWVCACVCVCYG